MILAFAGRRVDATGASPPRFPLANVAAVRNRVRAVLLQHSVSAVVGSAACGADLIMLSQAGSLGLRCTIILPFSREQFRASSVTDRPGDWGALYDLALEQSEVIELAEPPGDRAYIAVNRVILDTTTALMKKRQQPGSAVILWEGIASGHPDITQEFAIEARSRGLAVVEVQTL